MLHFCNPSWFPCQQPSKMTFSKFKKLEILQKRFCLKYCTTMHKMIKNPTYELSADFISEIITGCFDVVFLSPENSIFVVKYIFPKYLPEFINNRLSSRSSECTAARFKYPANRPGGGGRYSLPLRAVSSPRHSPLHTAHRLRGGR